jgi:NAD(P)-dependent dehydrogenase (short-subunit alcohol dehydrogenase family)
MSSYFITGANRGLGLALSSHLAQLPASQVSTIFAGTRASSASGDLQKLIESSNGRVVHTSVAITDRASIDAAVLNVQARLDGKGLDVLINNAGAMHWVPEGGIAKMDNLRETFDINVQAVQDTTAAFIPLLRQGSLKKVVNM